MTRLVLPLPPSVNSAYRNISINRRVRTPATQQYMNAAGWAATAWARKAGWTLSPKGQKVVLRLWYWWPDKARRDTHNREKVLLDALEGVLYEDDCNVLVQEQDYQIDRANPRVEIELELMQ